MTNKLIISEETSYTDIEHDFIENEPPGLFPTGQDSVWGQVRKVFADYLQVIADNLLAYYYNLSPDTTNEADMHNWERMLKLPVNPPDMTAEERRTAIKSHFRRGPFTRTWRKEIVESFLRLPQGTPIIFTPTGVPFDPGGLPFFSEPFVLATAYRIVENIPAFSYDVRVLNSVDLDTVSLQRELARITPAGISFTITPTANP